MNNQFLQHLKSITPEGKAEEKKIFISAERLKELEAEAEGAEENIEEAQQSTYKMKGPRKPQTPEQKARAKKFAADAIARRASGKPGSHRIGGDWKEGDKLSEATQSKYNKIYGRHVVGGQSKLKVASMKRAAAILRRGGADDETIRKGSDPFNVPMSHYNDVNMARYRFFDKARTSKENAKKSPRKSVSEAVSTGDPNRGRTGRAKVKLPPGLDPYDMYSKGEIQPYGGKLQKRLRSMSAEDRKRYYEQIGIRSRAASRGGKTQRLFPMTEGVQRMRRLRTARFGKQGYDKGLDDAYDKELSKVSANRLRRGGAPKQTVRGFFTDKPTTKAADKAYGKFTKDAMNKASAKGKKIFEATRVGRKIMRKIVKAKNRLRNIGRKVVDTLGTPQDNTDYMLTDRKF